MPRAVHGDEWHLKAWVTWAIHVCEQLPQSYEAYSGSPAESLSQPESRGSPTTGRGSSINRLLVLHCSTKVKWDFINNAESKAADQTFMEIFDLLRRPQERLNLL